MMLGGNINFTDGQWLKLMKIRPEAKVVHLISTVGIVVPHHKNTFIYRKS